MPSLSFEKSKGATPIAQVKGGDYDKEVLYLTNEDNAIKKAPKKEINGLNYSKDMKNMGLKKNQQASMIYKLQEAMAKGIPVEMLMENENVKDLYNKIQEDDKNDTSIVLPTDSSFHLIPTPDPKVRQVWYITGQSGSGKSYIARGLAEYYKKIFPEREIYLVSKLNEDSTLDTMKIGKPKRINVQSLMDDYPDIKEFQNCMIIFDDYDSFPDKTGKVVQQLIDDLAIQGRHTNTTMLCLTHFTTNYKKTRLLLGEATNIVVYPQSTSSHALKYLLGTHFGLGKEDLAELKKLGRWVSIGKNYPSYLISEHTAKLLHQK
jgi:ABC-type glutathione transport system ATPase component